jgi:hypothetical protein
MLGISGPDGGPDCVPEGAEFGLAFKWYEVVALPIYMD